MTTTRTDVTVIPSDTWDDTDHAIYEARIRQQQSLRAVAQTVGLHHEQVRRRLTTMLRKVTFAEVDEMRTEEGHRLDELAHANHQLAGAAIEHLNLEAALKALKEIHAITKTRARLFGLELQPKDNRADPATLNELFTAYLAGHTDAKENA